ncbi:MAG: divalent-cation tolerance protein CutA [Alphaproteobacteria bacterium]
MRAMLVYVMCQNGEEAHAIARALVGERLAACANVLGAVHSFYRWQGAMAESAEVALILKTREALVERLTARVKELHGYSVPCVVALPIASGNPDYLAWIAAETA